MNGGLKEKHLTASIISAALIFSTFVMAGIVFIFHLFGMNFGLINLIGSGQAVIIIRPVFYFLGLSLLYGSRFLDAGILKRKFDSQDDILKALFTSSLIKAAFGEACAMFGFILFMLTGSYWDFILLFIVSLFYQIYNFPRKSAWQDFINAAKTGAVIPS